MNNKGSIIKLSIVIIISGFLTILAFHTDLDVGYTNMAPAKVIAKSSTDCNLTVKMHGDVFAIDVHPTVHDFHKVGSTIYLYREVGGLIGFRGKWEAEPEYH